MLVQADHLCLGQLARPGFCPPCAWPPQAMSSAQAAASSSDPSRQLGKWGQTP